MLNDRAHFVLSKGLQKLVNLISVGILATLFMLPNAKAVTIEYTSQNLGGNTWSYSYYLSGNTFNQYQGFQVYFDYNLYSNLDAFPAAPNADWSPITIPPDSGIPLPGVYDAIALVSSPSLANPFVISFDWSGGGQPAAQDFALYTCDDEFCSTGLTFGQTGLTVARNNAPPTPNPNPVPEPLTTLLIASGLLGMAFVRRRG
jgi:hypothetical protein